MVIAAQHHAFGSTSSNHNNNSGSVASAVMDTKRIELDCVVENREYVHKLGAALDTNNTAVKKQVFELLAALSAYNAEGHARTLETLEHYKVGTIFDNEISQPLQYKFVCNSKQKLKSARYRLEVVISELEKSPSNDYRVALLSFINCSILSAGCLQDQIRLRNEFIGIHCFLDQTA